VVGHTNAGTSVANPVTVMQRLLSRHFGVVKFFGVSLVVFFAGSAATTYVGSRLLMDVDDLIISTAHAESEAPADEEEDEARSEAARRLNDRALASMVTKDSRKRTIAEAVSDNNIFCPSCAPLRDEPLLAAAGPMGTGEVATSLSLQLLATMESDDPAWSMATIRDIDSNSLAPYTANEQIRPGVSLLSVERGRVVILNQGRREFITLGAEPAKKLVAKKPTTKKPSTKKPSKSAAIDGAEDAINCSNENACTIDRKFVEKLLANPRQLMSQARMMPVTQDGETAGFRVSRVKAGSLATMIGLKNGDILSEVNGQKLGSIDDAMAMYAKLRRANHLSVVIQRGGAVVTKEISIK